MSAPEPSRRRARAARAAREARRVDDALRVAAGAHRPVGIPVLRRPRRPRDDAPRRGGARRARREKAPFLKLLGSYPAAVD